MLFATEASASNVRKDAVVRVRFDPTDKTVVLVRVDPKQARQEKDARRQAHEAALLGRTDRG